MIKIPKTEKIEVDELIPVKEKVVIKAKQEERPQVLDAKVYKLKSVFVDYPIYITLSYISDKSGKKRPFEIFINSKDLTKAAEYAVLTRLISAIFRRSEDPTFILEELKSIYDPNGGYFKEGKYIPSLYAEIADILEQFFEDIGILKKKPKIKSLVSFGGNEENKDKKKLEFGLSLKVCPKCGQKTLKIEGGCITCINPECGYSKCD